MVVNRKKKCNKLRGSRTHGWGSPKKHRGSGSRGGVGNAGSGKKGQQKMTTKHNIKKRIGTFGFKRPLSATSNPKTINLQDIEKYIDKHAAKGNTITVLDISELGYDKVLAKGKLTKKLKITAKQFSKNAIEKIKKSGGEPNIKELQKKETNRKQETADDNSNAAS